MKFPAIVNRIKQSLGIPITRLLYSILYTIYFPKRYEAKTLMKWLNPGPSDVILDIGCGNGYYDKLISYNCQKIIGLDFDFNRIYRASLFNRRINTFYVVGDAASLPFRDEAFNKVISICAIEHFDNDADAIREMHRVIRVDGKVVLSADSLSHKSISESYRRMHQERFKANRLYTDDSLSRKMSENNFEVINTKYLFTNRFSLFLIELFNRLGGSLRNPLIIIYSLLSLPLLIFLQLIKILNGDSGFLILLQARKRSN